MNGASSGYALKLNRWHYHIILNGFLGRSLDQRATVDTTVLARDTDPILSKLDRRARAAGTRSNGELCISPGRPTG